MKPKLLVTTSTFPRWAADTDPPFVFELAKRLADDFDIIIHAPHYPQARTSEVIAGITVHRFRYFFEYFEKLAGSQGILPTLKRNKTYYLLVPFFLAAQCLSLFFLIRRIRPALIHAHWLIPQGLAAVVMNRLFGIPVVVTAHGADVFGLQHPFFLKIKQFVLNRATSVTAVSSALRTIILRDNPGIEVAVIPMGVDAQVFRPGKTEVDVRKHYGIEGKLILFVGRLSEKKGVRYLIDAMPMVLREFPEAKLLIVGSGELEEELKNHVQDSAERREQVVFAGGVPNNQLPSYYAGADVFVGPSIEAKGGDTEGFGLTFVEAALAGCLLIGSDVGGIRDIIEDNQTGFLVPEKNSRALAEKIIYGLQGNSEIAAITRRARSKCAEKFDWNTIARQYAELLLLAVNSPKR